ncbi:glutamate receptor 2 [Plakobranchus ocellatus]|uniref:Glutamate receptor 2 n=1 Tax=Plakobranchus ocellatus TaxID=259542 RepID=A0AAV4DF00_9GAST|nr:glutamate receptor 2 [Plakobranchus ocellatus]
MNRLCHEQEPPFVMASAPDASGNVTFSGMTIELVKLLAKRVGFAYKFRLTDHTDYGHKDETTDVWKGLISEVINSNKYTIAAGPVPVTRAAESVAKFSKPFASTGIKMLVKKPSQPSEGIALMLEPFSAEVWVMIVLAFIVISLALFLIARFSPFERAKPGRDPYNPRSTFGLKNSFLFACTTMALQGYRQAPRSISGRILICMWLMFVVIVLVAYAANLSSILTTRGHDKQRRLPFTDVEDLVRQGNVRLGAMKPGYVYTTMKNSVAYKYVSDSGEWTQSYKEGIQQVKDTGGDYVFLMDAWRADYATATNCDLMLHGPTIAQYGFSFAFPTDSPIKNSIDSELLELRASGTLTELMNKYLHDPRVCPAASAVVESSTNHLSRSPSLDMNDMAIPFLFLFLGLLGAGAALGAELYYLKWKAEHRDPDAKARQPLNTEASSSKAPTTSPPPAPIYKVNNKLQEEQQQKEQIPEVTSNTAGVKAGTVSSEGDDKSRSKGTSSIETSPADEGNRTEEDMSNQKDNDCKVEVEPSQPAKIAAAEIKQTTADVENEVA